jgi:hypothetical protein
MTPGRPTCSLLALLVLLLLPLGAGASPLAPTSDPDALLIAQSPGSLRTVIPLLPASRLTEPQAQALAALLPHLACADAQHLPLLLDLLEGLRPASPRGALLLALALPKDPRLTYLAQNAHWVFAASPEAGLRLLQALQAQPLSPRELEALLPPIAARVSATHRKTGEAILDLLADPASKSRATFATALLSASHSGDLPEWWAAHLLDEDLASLAACEGLLRAATLGTLSSQAAEERLALQKDRARGFATITRLFALPPDPGSTPATRIGRLPPGPLRVQASFLASLGAQAGNLPLAAENLGSPWQELLALWQGLPPAPPAPPPPAPAEAVNPWSEDWELFTGAQRLLDSYPRSARDGCEAIGDEVLRDECRFRIFEHTLRRDPLAARNRLVEIVDSGLRLRAALRVAVALGDQAPATLLAPLGPLFLRAGAQQSQEAALQALAHGAGPALAYYLLERQVTNPALRCRALRALGASTAGLEEVLPQDCSERFCLAVGALAASLGP